MVRARGDAGAVGNSGRIPLSTKSLAVRTISGLIEIAGFELSDLRRLASFFRLMVRERFLGSALGLVWSVTNPILMLGIFTFVFGFVFKSKLPGSDTSLSFVIWLISGYGPWLAMSESLIYATTSVPGSASLIKNLKFKTELVPMAGALTGVIPLLVSFVYLVVLLVLDGRVPNAAWLVIAPYIIMQFAFATGLGLILAAANVFVRDIQMVLPNVLLVIMFASPIFYPITAFPPIAQKVMAFNPFFLLAEGFRQPLLYDTVPPLVDMLRTAVIACVAFAAGLWSFRRFKDYFDSEL